MTPAEIAEAVRLADEALAPDGWQSADVWWLARAVKALAAEVERLMISIGESAVDKHNLMSELSRVRRERDEARECLRLAMDVAHRYMPDDRAGIWERCCRALGEEP